MNKKIIALAVAAAVSAPMAAQAGMSGSVAYSIEYANSALSVGTGPSASVTWSETGASGNGITTAVSAEFDLDAGAWDEGSIKLSQGGSSFTISDGKLGLATSAGGLSLGLGIYDAKYDVTVGTSAGGLALSLKYIMPDTGDNNYDASISTTLGGASVKVEFDNASGSTAWEVTAGLGATTLNFFSSNKWDIDHSVAVGGGVSLGLGYGSDEVASAKFKMGF